MSPLNIIMLIGIALLVGLLLKVRHDRRRAEDDEVDAGGSWLTRAAPGEPAAPMAAGASWVVGGGSSAAGAVADLAPATPGADPEWAGLGRADSRWSADGDPVRTTPADAPPVTTAVPDMASAVSAPEAPVAMAAPSPPPVAAAPAVPPGATEPAAAWLTWPPGSTTPEAGHASPAPPAGDVAEPAPRWDSWESWGSLDRTARVDAPPPGAALAAAEQSAALVADPPTTASEAAPPADTDDASVAWWDQDEPRADSDLDSSSGPDSAPSSRADGVTRGHFALGGHAVYAGQPAVGGATFRRPLPAPPRGWSAGSAGAEPGTLVLNVEAAVNCDPGDVEVVWDDGFAPTCEGFSLRVPARDAGPFMVSGWFDVVDAGG